MLSQHEKENAKNALWYGLFLFEDIEGYLDKQIENQHVTFGYKIDVPEGIDWDEIYTIDVIGYGCDDCNEGYLVSFPEELEQFYFGAPAPHITISVSNSGNPVDTADLDFIELEEPFELEAKFGYFSRGKFFF